MSIQFNPIGYVKTDEKVIPHCWNKSDSEGSLIIDKDYQQGIRDLKTGQYIFVLFHNHKSPQFSENNITINHPSETHSFGVFSTYSPVRPNPIGMAFLEVVGVNSDSVRVKGLDMVDGTPILDIKPDACPWDC